MPQPDIRRRPWARAIGLALALAVAMSDASAGDLTREQALQALVQPDPAARLAALERLAAVGRMGDVPRLVLSLRDAEPALREQAAATLWQVWSRSGDAATDALYARGVAQMRAGAYADALASFDTIVRRRPAFAEGWNKRATLYFALGRYAESLHDVDEVLKRNPHHFGALSGAGQIHLRLGHDRQALDFLQRARDIHPGIDGLDELIPALRQRLREAGDDTV